MNPKGCEPRKATCAVAKMALGAGKPELFTTVTRSTFGVGKVRPSGGHKAFSDEVDAGIAITAVFGRSLTERFACPGIFICVFTFCSSDSGVWSLCRLLFFTALMYYVWQSTQTFGKQRKLADVCCAVYWPSKSISGMQHRSRGG